MSNNVKFRKALGKNIDKLRKEKGLSFQELAHRCEMEKSQLVTFCTQGTNITLDTLSKISKGLDLPLSKIFDFPYK